MKGVRIDENLRNLVIKDLKEGILSTNKIAKKYNLGRSTVSKINVEYNVNPEYASRWSKRKLNESDIAEIVKLLTDGFTHQVIANKFGVSTTMIRDIKRDYTSLPRKQRITEEMLKQIDIQRSAGYSWDEIAKGFNAKRHSLENAYYIYKKSKAEQSKEKDEEFNDPFTGQSKEKDEEFNDPFTGQSKEKDEEFNDPFTGIWFVSTKSKILNGTKRANALLRKTGFITANELRTAWGFPNAEICDQFRIDISECPEIIVDFKPVSLFPIDSSKNGLLICIRGDKKSWIKSTKNEPEVEKVEENSNMKSIEKPVEVDVIGERIANSDYAANYRNGDARCGHGLNISKVLKIDSKKTNVSYRISSEDDAITVRFDDGREVIMPLSIFPVFVDEIGDVCIEINNYVKTH